MPPVPLDELFEATSPLAVRLAARPVTSPTKLMERAWALASQLSDSEKVATLNAHPRIGAKSDRVSERSRREQGDETVPELQQLNREYERKFGFRFVVFVNRRPKAEIAEVLRNRLRRSRAEELEEGLRSILEIAEDRLRT